MRKLQGDIVVTPYGTDGSARLTIKTPTGENFVLDLDSAATHAHAASIGAIKAAPVPAAVPAPVVHAPARAVAKPKSRAARAKK